MSDEKNMDLKKQSPSIQRDYNSEKELLDLMEVHHKYFLEYLSKLKNQYDYLKKTKKEFPLKYITNDDFEDLMLKASQAKHQALDFALISSSISAEIDIKLDHFTSYYKIYLADDALKSLNFIKVTDTMRQNYVSTKKEVSEFSLLKVRYEELSSAFDKMLRMFSDDEINFRRFLEKKDKMLGLK